MCCSQVNKYIAYVVGLTCRARHISFCLQKNTVPVDLNQVFGILKPPPSVLRRFCKILRSELWRQVRRIQDHLRVLCYLLDPGWVAESKLRAITRLMANMIEVTWAQILHQELRMAAMKRCAPPPPPKKNVTTVGDVLVPEDVENLLNKGPEFSLEPDVKGQEWLSLNRQIARKAPEEKHEKCLLDGVDALMKAGGTATTRSGKDPLGKVVDYFQRNKLCLLLSDKEGGFVVME
ncbi:hypothetical protein HPB50_004676 [Hyalomma asiaticum]|uniref:Uncharacterized protein n=1 Tax=Hyalomma asiaticum TaxID=266040 RepID=A0ACB7SCH7_HYAAI|nr:hypothetical protein HPB50_004676 [Hyalomma asiaticum]